MIRKQKQSYAVELVVLVLLVGTALPSARAAPPAVSNDLAALKAYLISSVLAQVTSTPGFVGQSATVHVEGDAENQPEAKYQMDSNGATHVTVYPDNVLRRIGQDVQSGAGGPFGMCLLFAPEAYGSLCGTFYHELIHACRQDSWMDPASQDPKSCQHAAVEFGTHAALCTLAQETKEDLCASTDPDEKDDLGRQLDGICYAAEQIENKWQQCASDFSGCMGSFSTDPNCPDGFPDPNAPGFDPNAPIAPCPDCVDPTCP